MFAHPTVDSKLCVNGKHVVLVRGRRKTGFKSVGLLKGAHNCKEIAPNKPQQDHRSQVVFAMICPALVLPAIWMLPVDKDSLPASQSAALEQMTKAKVARTLISASQLAQLIGKSQSTAFGALVEVWTADAAWKPMSQCPDLLGALQDALLGVAGSLAELITPAAAPDQHPTDDPADESPAETPGTSAARAAVVGAREASVGAREAALGSRETALGSRETALENRETALGCRENALGSREAAVRSRETAVRSREVALGARETTIGTTRVAAAAVVAVLTKTAAQERYELEMEERKAEGAAGALVNLGSKRPRRS